MAQNKTNSGILEMDVHNMTAYQAKTTIDYQLKAVDHSVYRIRIIHGFHGGTTLKKLITEEYSHHRKVLRIERGINAGVTDLVLREL